jgi:hypothetical protein
LILVVFIAGTTCLISFFFVYKGAPGVDSLKNIKPEVAGGISAGVGIGCGLLSCVTFIPYVKYKLRKEDEAAEVARQAQEQAQAQAAELPGKEDDAVDYYVDPTRATLPDYSKTTDMGASTGKDLSDSGIGSNGNHLAIAVPNHSVSSDIVPRIYIVA